MFIPVNLFDQASFVRVNPFVHVIFCPIKTVCPSKGLPPSNVFADNSACPSNVYFGKSVRASNICPIKPAFTSNICTNGPVCPSNVDTSKTVRASNNYSIFVPKVTMLFLIFVF